MSYFVGNSTVNSSITATTASIVSNSSSTALFVAANGNVGVGTSSPGSALHITGSAKGDGTAGNGVHIGVQGGYATIELVGTDASGSLIDFSVPNSDTKSRIINYATNNHFSIISGGGTIHFGNTGLLGVNRSSTTDRFEVAGSIGLFGNQVAVKYTTASGNTIGQIIGYNDGAADMEIMSARGLGLLTGRGYGLGTSSGFHYFGPNGGLNIGYSALNMYSIPTNGIVCSGSVGIGNSSPLTKLHVYDSGDPIIRCESSTAGQAGQFSAVGKGASSYPGFSLQQDSNLYWTMQLRADTNLYLFRQSGSGNVIIPSGKLGVGVSSPNHSIATTVSMAITASGGAQYLLMGNQDSGGVNKPGIIRSFNGGQFEIGFGDSWTNSTGGNFTNVFAVYSPAGTVCLKGGNTSAGGTGITFPTTQSASSDANTLDDYEEGTWTPAWRAGTLANTPTFTYTSQQGRYVKIGMQVTVWCKMIWSNKTGGTADLAFISGLPFTQSNQQDHPGGGTINYASGLPVLCNLYADAASNYMVCMKNNAGVSYLQITTDVGSSGQIMLSYTYYTNS
jgi:hypothetical protein